MNKLQTGILVLLMPAMGFAQQSLKVNIDASQAPQLQGWCEQAKSEMEAWFPRLINLMAPEGESMPSEINFQIKDSNDGVAYTAGTQMVAMSGWVTSHPEDIGLTIHELVHVVQHYPTYNPAWVVEGLADYFRWGIYEGKPLSWFPQSSKKNGYEDSYQVTAGFFLWLERGPAPGIVRQLDSAMRKKDYDERIFRDCSGKSLDNLWKDYVKARKG
ncbi:MAG: hypothetical protein JXR25_11495 [Pontiellaceae bacterium]|nr:hypothetical protein [Pontiellaceae bacterium]MBN2785438.1 hypothetical protein [Pontiellaceae bacterium]